MAIDFSSIGAEPAESGKIDFSALGGIPAVGQDGQEDETTALGAAGRGAVGMIPLGEQAYAKTASVLENKPYVEEREALEKEIEADKENHQVARLAGQAAGLVAPIALTGGAAAPESLAGAAGQGALIGGGFGAGNAIDTIAKGGTGKQAAGELAMGAGLGAAGGTVGQKLAGLMGEAVHPIETFAARKAAQGVGMGSDELGNMSRQELLDTGKMLMDKGIVKQGASTQEMFDRAKAIHENYGNTIGQIGNQATELGLTTDTKPLLDVLGEKYNTAEQLANPDERKAAVWYKRGMADILAMANQNGAERLAPDIATEQPGSFITFDQLQKLKKSYGNSAFESGAVKNPAAADIYGQLTAGQKAIVSKAEGNPNLPGELKDAMTGYSKLYPVVNGLQDVLGRERAGNMPAKGFGMMGKMVGQLPGQDKPAINALTSLGLFGAGHPMWGIGAATATLQNPRAMSNIAQGVARTIPDVAEKLPTVMSQITGLEAPGPVMHATAEHAVSHGIHNGVEGALQQGTDESKSPNNLNIDHPALAPWKPAFQKNAANAQNEGEVKKSRAITDFVLSQRDPAYAAAKQKASEDSEKAPQGMSEGGIVAPGTDSMVNREGEPTPGVTSTLNGLENVIEKVSQPPAKKDTLPTQSGTRFHQPFNPDFADKLREFLLKEKESADAE